MPFSPSLAWLDVPGSPKHFLYPRSRRSHLYPGVSAAWGMTLGKQRPLCVLTAADSSCLEGLWVDELGFTLLHFRCSFLLLWHFNYTCLFLHGERWTLFSLYPPIILSVQISAWVSVWAATRWREHCASSFRWLCRSTWDCFGKISALWFVTRFICLDLYSIMLI